MLLCPFENLETGSFSSRYKRFFVDVVRADGSVEVVHCANTGSMKSCLLPQVKVYTSRSDNPNRKLKSSLELMELPDGLACLNTVRANDSMDALFEHYFKCKAATDFSFEGAELFCSDFSKFHAFDREPKLNKETRFDFGFRDADKNQRGWLEIKSVSLRLADDVLAFPDAVTERGQKHLFELTELAKSGAETWLVFVVMRAANLEASAVAKTFRAAHEIDTRYAELLHTAIDAGVKVRIVVPRISPEGIGIRGYFNYFGKRALV